MLDRKPEQGNLSYEGDLIMCSLLGSACSKDSILHCPHPALVIRAVTIRRADTLGGDEPPPFSGPVIF